MCPKESMTPNMDFRRTSTFCLFHLHKLSRKMPSPPFVIFIFHPSIKMPLKK